MVGTTLLPLSLNMFKAAFATTCWTAPAANSIHFCWLLFGNGKITFDAISGKSDFENFRKEVNEELRSMKNYITESFQQIFTDLKNLNRCGYDTVDSKASASTLVRNVNSELGIKRSQKSVVEDHPMKQASIAKQGRNSDEEGVPDKLHIQHLGSDIRHAQVINQNKVKLYESDGKSDTNGGALINMHWNEVDNEKRMLTLDDYEEPLITESQLMEIETKFMKNKTQQLMKRVTLSEKHKRLPFVDEFMSGGSGTKLRPRIFDTKHPFTLYIGAPLNVEEVSQFNAWIDNGNGKNTKRRKTPYSKEDNFLSEPFYLGVVRVDKKDWFHSMVRFGQPWNDKHIDVIMYYLRKKGKYDPFNPVSFTTTDCCFKTRMVQAYNHYWMSKDDDTIESVKYNDPVMQYILGRRLLANVPWYKVDCVIFPCKIVDKYHWILIVFNIPDMTLIVYDSYKSATNTAVVREVVDAFSTMIPIFLNLSGFYENRFNIHSNHSAPSLRVTMLSDSLPQQDSGSLDCGVYVSVFAEYASMGQVTPKDRFDVQFHRTRYASLLWNYARKKQELEAISESEDCGSLGRKKLGAQKKKC